MPTQTIEPVSPDAILETFLDMVRLDSPSGQEGPVRDYLLKRFTALQLTPEVDDIGNIIVSVPASTTNNNNTLVMTGHMDVVPPCIGIQPIIEGQGNNQSVRSSGNTVLGADDKSGLAAMLTALEMSLKFNTPRPNLLFLITVEEEVLLSGAKAMNPKWYQHAHFAIALDHTGEQGTVIYEAPSYVKFKASVHGKSVHAGIMPEKGVNAIQLLCQAVEKCTWGRLDEETTTNLGFIQGGKATNVVPDLAWVEGEIRGHNEETIKHCIQTLEAALKETTQNIPDASFELDTQFCFQHYQTDPNSPMVRRITDAIKQLGLPLNLIRTNGGSDINIFAANGVPGIVLSAGYIAPHSLQERVYVKDMITCTNLLIAIWEQFAA